MSRRPSLRFFAPCGALGLGFLCALGCTVAHTPAEPTPVYAEAPAKGAKPLPVERLSIREPEPTLVPGTSGETPAPPVSTTTDAPPSGPHAPAAGPVPAPEPTQPSAPEPSTKPQSTSAQPQSTPGKPQSTSAQPQSTPGKPAPTPTKP